MAFRATPAGTRVTLLHGGWESLGEHASATCERYTHGWEAVFGQRYGDYCRAARPA